jgi:hypothetical protein
MKYCKSCGVLETEACVHDWGSKPDSCVCDVHTWTNEIPEACEKFEGEKGANCEKCEHDEECHK